MDINLRDFFFKGINWKYTNNEIHKLHIILGGMKRCNSFALLKQSVVVKFLVMRLLNGA